MKVEKNAVVLAPESCESKQNWLSYDFFEKTCSGGGDGDDLKSLHQVMHQNTLFWKDHNLISFARIYMIFVPTLFHFSLLLSYVLTKK